MHQKNLPFTPFPELWRKNKRYSIEEKQQFVARYYNGESVAEICLQSGIAQSTFYIWLKPHQTIQTEAGYEVSPAEFAMLRTRLAKLEQKVEI